jgi:hypothetical protein
MDNARSWKMRRTLEVDFFVSARPEFQDVRLRWKPADKGRPAELFGGEFGEIPGRDGCGQQEEYSRNRKHVASEKASEGCLLGTVKDGQGMSSMSTHSDVELRTGRVQFLNVLAAEKSRVNGCRYEQRANLEIEFANPGAQKLTPSVL